MLFRSLGGVTLTFDHPARDLKSGLDVGAGTHRLGGAQALAYARSRQYQELRNGEWQTIGGSDIGRTKRQQQLLLNLFDQVSSKKNVFNLPGFASTFAEEVTVDAGLSLGTLIELGRAALDLSTGDIEAVTLPVVDQRGADGGAYVVPGDEASRYLDAFRAGEPFSE